MATESPVIEVRRATKEDYQNVLDINDNVYLGLDYIPYYYDELVVDPDFSYYVCLVDGEVGAFEGVCLLDDNRSLMTRSARVKDKFQGQGLLAHIKKKIYEDYKDVPGEKNIRSCCTNQVRYVHSKTFRSQNKTLQIETIIQLAEVDVRQVSPVCENLEDAKPISLDAFSHLLEIDVVRKHLFPQNLISTNSWFYDAVSSNIKHIGKWSPQIIITRHLYRFLPEQRTDQMEPLSDLGDEIDKGDNAKNICSQGLLGIVAHYFSPKYLLFAMNISGRLTQGEEIEEITALWKQALFSLQSLCSDKTKDQKAVCGVICNDREVPREMFYKALNPLGFLPSVWEPSFTEHYYFEQGFDHLIK